MQYRWGGLGLIFFMMLGCTLPVSNRVRPELPEPENRAVVHAESALHVALGNAEDHRTRSNVGNDGSEPIMLEGDAMQYVMLSLEDHLREHGIQLRALNSPRLTLFLDEWEYSIEKQFPSAKLRAQTKLSIALHRPDGTLILNGDYVGGYEAQAPVVRTSDIERALGYSLTEAISRIVGDYRFLDALRE